MIPGIIKSHMSKNTFMLLKPESTALDMVIKLKIATNNKIKIHSNNKNKNTEQVWKNIRNLMAKEKIWVTLPNNGDIYRILPHMLADAVGAFRLFYFWIINSS